MKVAVDTGGTFTDFVFKEDGYIRFFKLLSNPKNPSEAVLKGLSNIPNTEVLIHGTTVATNAFLERKGSRLALLTTKGFEDVIFIGRQVRPKLYDFFVDKPSHFIDPENVYGIRERIGSKGEVVIPLDKREIRKVITWLSKKSLSSVAIVFINSFVNPHHEGRLKESLEKNFENLDISTSFEVLPEFREYERTSTTAINAYLNPTIKNYLENLRTHLKTGKIFIQQSNGGYISIEEAAKFSVHTVLSGPAAGVCGAYKIGNITGRTKLITLDMGGTSTDVCLINDTLPFTREYMLDGFPLSIPVIDIHTVGAGGGSIAYVDKGGVLKVGPLSAGADPGPACYGKSYLPTVTDANLMLGRLLPDHFFMGRIKLDKDRAAKAIQPIAQQLGLTLYETALGIIKIINTHMARAIARVSLEKGYDPRDFVLFCYGGAGGLHACALARELSIKEILIPKTAGTFSALGLYVSHMIKDFSQTVFIPLNQDKKELLLEFINLLKNRALTFIEKSSYNKEKFILKYYADVRYKGQGFELTVPLERFSLNYIREYFEEEHQKQFGFNLKKFPVEIVTLRVRVEETSPFEGFRIENLSFRSVNSYTDVFTENGFKRIPVISWNRLSYKENLKGPLLIVDDFTTVYVEENFICEILEDYTLRIRMIGCSR